MAPCREGCCSQAPLSPGNTMNCEVISGARTPHQGPEPCRELLISTLNPHLTLGCGQNRTPAFLQNTLLSHVQLSHLHKRYHHSTRYGARKSGQNPPPFPSCPPHSHPIHLWVLWILAPKYISVFMFHSSLPWITATAWLPLHPQQTEGTLQCVQCHSSTLQNPPATDRGVCYPLLPHHPPMPSPATHVASFLFLQLSLLYVSPPPRERLASFPHLG